MKNLSILIFCLLNTTIGYTQWQWAKQLYSNGPDNFNNSCIDNSGNIYFAGSFKGSPFYAATDTLTLNSNSDAIIAKYDNSGNEIWIKQFGGTSFGCFNTVTLTMDSINNVIYAYFSFCGTAVFGTDTLNAFNRDIALVKFDLNGNVLWVRQVGGLGEDYGQGLTVDNSGNIYFYGSNSQQAVIDTIIQPPGGFFAKYDSDGNRLLVKKICDVGDFNSFAQYIAFSLVFYDNAIFMDGTTSDDTLTLDTMLFVNSNQYGSLFAKFDLNGNIQWAKKLAFPSSQVNFMNNDNSGNFYIAGVFYTDSTVFESTVLTNNGQADGFLAKYDENGNLKWVNQLQAATGGRFFNLNCLPDGGGVYTTGSFTGSAKFGGNTITAQSSNDMFLARYDSSGNCLGATTLPNTEGGAVEIDVNGEVIVTGWFDSNLQIGSNNLTNMGNYDIFIAKHSVIINFEENEKWTEEKLVIYANPTAGKCNIIVPAEFTNESILTLSIFDNTGKRIQHKVLVMENDKILINLEAEARGIYNASLSNGKKNYVGKIVFE